MPISTGQPTTVTQGGLSLINFEYFHICSACSLMPLSNNALNSFHSLSFPRDINNFQIYTEAFREGGLNEW